MVSEDSGNPFLIRPGEAAPPADAPPVESGTRRIPPTAIPAALPFVTAPAGTAPVAPAVEPASSPALPNPALRISDIPAPPSETAPPSEATRASELAAPAPLPGTPAPATAPTSVVPPAATTLSEQGWQLRLGDGEVVAIASTLLVGRNPSPRADAPDAALLAVDDPERTVSKTHARLAVEGGVVIVTDLSSTNGTTVQAGGDSIALAAGEQHRVEGSATVLFGSFPAQLERAPR